jgi:hypothetical protein
MPASLSNLKDFYLNNKSDFHTNIYFFGMLVMVVGLPFSMFLMSISQIIIAGNWLLEGNYKEKVQRFLKNRAALLITSIFLIHVIGLIYTEDFNYALKDLRIKSPLFILSFILGSIEFHNKKKIDIILLTFCSAILLSSLYCVFKFANKPVADLRQIFVFVSHIRYGLLIDVAICILFYYSFRKNHFKPYHKAIFLLASLWLFVFILISQLITGFIILIFAILIVIIVYFLLHKNWVIKFIPLALFSVIMLFSFNKIIHDYKTLSKKNPYDYKSLKDTTALGNSYVFYPFLQEYENGNYIWVFFCEKELENAWNQRSNIKYTESDLKRQPLKHTLIRFLTSLNYRKDAAGVNKLTDEQVAAIENGIVNWKYMTKYGMLARYNQTIAEIVNFSDTKNPNGSSLVQRLEYWKTAIDIIKKNFILGVGTGDVNNAFLEEYSINNSSLEPAYRHRAHNQYLEFAVTFGIVGLVCFLIALIYPVVKMKKFDFLYIAFFIIAFLSMLTEDTLETQAGISFFAFFTTFLLFCRHKTLTGDEKKE